MKRQGAMQARQLEPAALFLEEHPGFSPELQGPDAIVRGFRLGGCFITLAEMEGLIAVRPLFNASEAALLMARQELAWRWNNESADLGGDRYALPDGGYKRAG